MYCAADRPKASFKFTGKKHKPWDPTEEWKCNECKYENFGYRRECGECGEPRPELYL